MGTLLVPRSAVAHDALSHARRHFVSSARMRRRSIAVRDSAANALRGVPHSRAGIDFRRSGPARSPFPTDAVARRHSPGRPEPIALMPTEPRGAYAPIRSRNLFSALFLRDWAVSPSDPRSSAATASAKRRRSRLCPTPERWRDSQAFCFAVDLFNHGYYWESHEVWESLWHACGRRGTAADFLKSLIKLAAAGVKVAEGRRRLAAASAAGTRTACPNRRAAWGRIRRAILAFHWPS